MASWFRFVRPNLVDLEAGRAAAIWTEDIAPRLDRFLSRPAFERLCRAYVRARMGHDPRFPTRGEVGAWWGTVTERTPAGPRSVQRESEVVVLRDRQLVMVGEAKWSAGPVGVDSLEQLRRTAAAIPGHVPGTTTLALFAREGFTDQLKALQGDDVLLVPVADMLDGW